MNGWRMGVDIGSTTLKTVVLDENGRMVFSRYVRHHAQIQEKLTEILAEIRNKCEARTVMAAMTGSGGMGISTALGLPFVQEVVAVAAALREAAPETDVAIELGGEDAKIIYFTGGLEERMNGVCAGGTGSFIDQMAALMQTDAEGLNREAGQLMSLLYAISANDEALSEDCENGLVLACKTGADTDFAYVADAESAAYLCAIITDALNTGAAAEEPAVPEAE